MSGLEVLLLITLVIDAAASVAVFFALIDAIEDFRTIHRFEVTDSRHMVSRADVRSHGFRLITVLVLAAMVIMVLPRIANSTITLANLLLFGMFSLASVLIAANSWLDLRIRRRLDEVSRSPSSRFSYREELAALGMLSKDDKDELDDQEEDEQDEQDERSA